MAAQPVERLGAQQGEVRLALLAGGRVRRDLAEPGELRDEEDTQYGPAEMVGNHGVGGLMQRVEADRYVVGLGGRHDLLTHGRRPRPRCAGTGPVAPACEAAHTGPVKPHSARGPRRLDWVLRTPHAGG